MICAELYRAANLCAGTRWARDYDLDPVRRPNGFTRVQAKCVAGNLVVDVRKKIFIRCDAESGRAISPLDRKRAAGLDGSESADRALIRLNIAVASNSDPMASGNGNHACGKKYGGDFLHRNALLSMRRDDGRFWIQKFAI